MEFDSPCVRNTGSLVEWTAVVSGDEVGFRSLLFDFCKFLGTGVSDADEFIAEVL